MERERRLILGVSISGLLLVVFVGGFFALVFWAALQLD